MWPPLETPFHSSGKRVICLAQFYFRVVMYWIAPIATDTYINLSFGIVSRIDTHIDIFIKWRYLCVFINSYILSLGVYFECFCTISESRQYVLIESFFYRYKDICFVTFQRQTNSIHFSSFIVSSYASTTS